MKNYFCSNNLGHITSQKKKNNQKQFTEIKIKILTLVTEHEQRVKIVLKNRREQSR